MIAPTPTSMVHPAYEAIRLIERAWSDDKDQVSGRTDAVVASLVIMGVLIDGFWEGKYYCVSRERWQQWQASMEATRQIGPVY